MMRPVLLLSVSLPLVLLGGCGEKSSPEDSESPSENQAATSEEVEPDEPIAGNEPAATVSVSPNFEYEIQGDTATITGCDKKATGALIIPVTIEGKPVASIGKSAFSRCYSLTSIRIPDSVTSIGKEAFSGCTSLTSIIIPDSVTSIGKHAFSSCFGLTSITIPDSVTSIGHETFRECTSLASITIGSSVTSIGREAFRECTSLASITIPNSVTSIRERAFSYCTSLTSITIGNGVTSIGDGAFEDCTNLTAITFQGAAPTVGVEAFLNVPDEAVARVPSESLGSYRWYGLNLRTGDQFDTITDLEAQLAEAIVQKDAAIAERDARPTLFQLGAAEADRDAVIADIQLAFDEVNAVGGGVEDDLASIVDPANAPLDTLKAGVIAQPLESFEVTTLDSLNNLDIGLGLYDTDGNLLATNDDAGPTVQSQLSFPDGLAGGVYYLAVGTDNSVFNSDFEVSSTGLGGEYALTLPTGPVSGTLEPSGVVWYCIEIGTDFAVLELQPLTDLYRNLVEDNATAISERDAAIKERDAAIKERDAKIAELEQGGGGQNLEQVLEQVTDARAGSVVINLSNGEASISFSIEESEDLKTWQATGEKITKTIQLKDGKKFYRFALDK